MRCVHPVSRWLTDAPPLAGGALAPVHVGWSEDHPVQRAVVQQPGAARAAAAAEATRGAGPDPGPGGGGPGRRRGAGLPSSSPPTSPSASHAPSSSRLWGRIPQPRPRSPGPRCGPTTRRTSSSSSSTTSSSVPRARVSEHGQRAAAAAPALHARECEPAPVHGLPAAHLAGALWRVCRERVKTGRRPARTSFAAE